jgi:ricin-type beta-trefoil lectin protein/putative Ig domain-containing protein
MHRHHRDRHTVGSGRAGGRPGNRIRPGVGALIAAAGLAATALAAVPASAMASAAAPPAAGRDTAAVRAAGHRAAPPAPLSAQRPLAAPQAPKLPGVSRVCPVPTRAGQMECLSLIRASTGHRLGVARAQAVSGYGPADLRSAYNLASASSKRGVGETIAVVDAFNDSKAVSDLATYRAHYGLPPCQPGTGAGCVTKLNQQGNPSPLPPGNVQWAAQESMDLDMVSAICPNCHILLVEANTNGLGDLGTADNTAVGAGAKFLSNSWDGTEFPSESFYDNVYFNHPGVAIAVASGGGGYGTGWPSSSQYVTSVGGTNLTRDSGVSRGWTETVWSGSGSGCSGADPKPAWQTADDSASGGCLNRTENDVAAVANPKPGVAFYDTYHRSGWSVMGGTSVATPIIAAGYALAGNPAPRTYPASYPYRAAHAALNDVTSGSNGTCEASRRYLCHAGAGYDGPTGNGTPHGTGAFASTATGNVVTITNPGVQDEQAGTPVFLAMQALDSAAGQTLTYSATGLPSGLSIDRASGHITGTLGSAASASTVRVTATDGTGATSSVTFSMVVVKSLTTGYHGVSGPVHVDLAGMCMDDTGNAATNGNKVQIWSCNGKASQDWTFEPDGNPGGAGTLTIHGKCLDIFNRGTANETKVQLFTCNGGANQQWLIDGSAGELFNPVSGRCLTDPGGTKNGVQLWISNCSGKPDQAWILPASPVQSGIAGMCLKDPNNAAVNGTQIQISPCSGRASERWTMEPDGTLRINGKCLDVAGASKLDGAKIDIFTCQSADANQHWAIGSNGELFSLNSGRCVADPGDSTTNGTGLVQEDCYGRAGEIWAVT